MNLPSFPEMAYPAAGQAAYDTNDDLDAILAAAWPHMYAAALEDFADRAERILDIVGVGESPIGAYRFLVACARTLAHDALHPEDDE